MQIGKWMSQSWRLLRDAGIAWDRDNIAQQGAALAFFTVFSLSPLLILILVLSGIVFGEEAASGALLHQTRGMIGEEAAQFIRTLIVSINASRTVSPAVIFGGIMLWLGASGVFLQLRDSLNMILRVRLRPTGTIVGFLRGRWHAFVMIAGVALFLFLSLVLNTLFSAAGRYLSANAVLFPGAGGILDLLLTLAGMVLLSAFIFKFLPAATMEWKDVWVGAAVTSLLFAVGKLFIGWYVQSTSVDSAFGAARSLIVFMAWVYYSSQMLLLGAEFTRLYAERFGHGSVPTRQAVRIPEPPVHPHHHERQQRKGTRP